MFFFLPLSPSAMSIQIPKDLMAGMSRKVNIGPQATVTKQSCGKGNRETRCPAQRIVKQRELLQEKLPWQPVAGSETTTRTLVRDPAGAADKENTILHCAASQGLVDVVESILAKGKTPCDLLDRYGRTALHWAAEQGHLLVTQALLNTGANFETRCVQNRTPLMLAALGGHEEVVCMMLKAGAGVVKHCNKLPPSISSWKSTALHYAASGGHLGVVSTLLDAGFDKEQRDEAGLTPVEISVRAARASSPAVARRLLPSDMGARMVYDYVNMMMEDIETVAGLAKCGAFLDWQDVIGNSPLHRTAHFQHVNISKILLQYGAETDLRDHRGGSPLHIAACQGSVAIATALLEAGADKEARMVNGRSPLHLAVINDNIDVVTLLVRNEAFTEHCDRSRDQTPLSEAAEYGLAPIIRILLEAGADVESTSLEGLTPLHWACRFNHSTSVEVLLASGANPDVVDGAAAKAAKFMWSGQSEISALINAFEPTAFDVVGLGDPCRWNEDARRPFLGELESVANQRLNLASRSKIIYALQRARKNRTWRRRGWLLILANRQKGVGNAEDIITLTSEARMGLDVLVVVPRETIASQFLIRNRMIANRECHRAGVPMASRARSVGVPRTIRSTLVHCVQRTRTAQATLQATLACRGNKKPSTDLSWATSKLVITLALSYLRVRRLRR